MALLLKYKKYIKNCTFNIPDSTEFLISLLLVDGYKLEIQVCTTGKSSGESGSIPKRYSIQTTFKERTAVIKH
jgi:hypothetical protein